MDKIFIGIDPATAKPTAVTVRTPDSLHLFLVDSFDHRDIYNKVKSLGLPDLPTVLVIESQQIYPGSKVRTKDTLNLANRSGFFEGVLCASMDIVEIKRPLPAEWKGQVPAPIYTNRIIRKHPEIKSHLKGHTDQAKEDLVHSFGLSFF